LAGDRNTEKFLVRQQVFAPSVVTFTGNESPPLHGIVYETDLRRTLESMDDLYGRQFTNTGGMAICETILDALRELHRKGFVVVDLNPSDIVRSETYPYWRLKGLSTFHKEGDHIDQDIKDEVSMEYVSPEVFAACKRNDRAFEFHSKSDIWSFGLLVLRFMFNLDLFSELALMNIDSIEDFLSNPEAPLIIDSFLDNHINKLEYRDLHKAMLNFERLHRPSAEQIKESHLFASPNSHLHM
jgi:serine/threonine protein kinase